MHERIGTFFCAVIVVHAIGGVVWARDAIATSGAMPPRVRIDIVFDGPRLASRLEASAMKEVIHIWAAYGVDVNTLEGGGCGRDGAVRLTVKIADGADPGTSQVLGAIRFRGDAPEPEIVIYPDAIAVLASSTPFGRDLAYSQSAFHDVVLGRVLGRALAHEIGHFLLRSPIHSTTGLMRALQPAVDFVAPDRHGFGLSGDEATRLVAVLPIALQSSPPPTRAAAPVR